MVAPAAIDATVTALRDAGLEAAVVEAGLGGRLDATNVIDAPVVVLTNVSLEHTDVLGSTREAIAAEKLAVVPPGATVVLSESEWEEVARALGAARVVHTDPSSPALAEAAATAFLGRPVDAAPASAVQPPGRLELRGNEVWDGAHNPAGMEWLVERLPPRRYVVVASILRDKDAADMLASLVTVADRLIATQSSNPRALPARELAALAPMPSAIVEDPAAALERARELAGPDGAVLVTGSLYLLQDLSIQPPAYHGETR